MPRISPARILRLTPWTAGRPSSASAKTPPMSRTTGAPVRSTRAARSRRGVSPIIMVAIVSVVVSETFPAPAKAPFLRTVRSSAKAVTSRNLCVIMSTVTSPRRVMSRRSPRISSASAGVSTEVGSSRMMKRWSSQSCFRISSFCFSPADRSATGRSSGARNGMRSRKAASARRSSFQSMIDGPLGRAITRFSAPVREGTSVKCW